MLLLNYVLLYAIIPYLSLGVNIKWYNLLVKNDITLKVQKLQLIPTEKPIPFLAKTLTHFLAS